MSPSLAYAENESIFQIAAIQGAANRARLEGRSPSPVYGTTIERIEANVRRTGSLDENDVSCLKYVEQEMQNIPTFSNILDIVRVRNLSKRLNALLQGENRK
jgi:hypothetical protein